jgi:transposase-like protein
MKCPYCKKEGTAYYISGSGTASKVYGCKDCKKKFRTKITRPEPPLRWEEAREVMPNIDVE